MKIYSNEFTKKILIGLTTITLVSSSFSEAKTIKNTSYIEQPVQIVHENTINYKDFNNFFDNLGNEISVLNDFYVPTSHIDSENYYYKANYDKGLKKVIYFANYDYISNTDLEKTLRDEKIVDTYQDSDFFGLNLNLQSAHEVLNDWLVYNHKCFVDFEYDEIELIKSRKFNTQNVSSLINPSIFLMNESDKKYTDTQFKKLVELIKYCNNNDKENIERCLFEYFNYQQNNLNVTSSTKWLNNVTNNNLCIKILETYMLQYCENKVKKIFGSFEYANIYFLEGTTGYCDGYEVDKIVFNNIEDDFLKIVLECDRKLHSDVYCNTDEFLLESIDRTLQKISEKIR